MIVVFVAVFFSQQWIGNGKTMNFISIANKIGNKARKHAVKQTQDLWGKTPENAVSEETKKAYIKFYRQEVLNLNDDLTEAFKDGGLVDVLKKHGFGLLRPDEKLTGTWFWITLRPRDEDKDRFTDFMIQTFAYLEREMFINWKMTFEQKGETMETLGTGYHCHIIANLKDRYHLKRVIKDTKSTWDKWFGGYVPDPFVKAIKMVTKKDVEIKTLYISGHKGAKHKKVAMELDPIWRKNISIKDEYTSRNWVEPA